MSIRIAFLLTAVGLASPPPRTREATDYMIVVTGGEMLEGAYADGHTLFLTRTLRPLGLHCVGSMIVHDRPADIKAALRSAAERAPLILITGGLGPTDNDITRETLSEFTGIPLKEDPDVLKELQRRYGGASGELRPNVRRQTRVPASGTSMKNANGTAVGLVFEQEKLVIVALPGPPRELQPMVRTELVPYLVRRFGARPPGCSLTLRFVGVGQSQIDQTLKEHAPLPPDIVLYSTFEADRVDFTFTLPGDTQQDRERLEELKRKIVPHMGDPLYAEGDVTLEQCVIGMLRERGTALALAEAGSGGALAAALSEADGTGKVFSGAHVAPTEEALRRMLGVADDRWGAEAPGDGKAKLLADAAADSAKGGWVIAVGEVRSEGDRGPWVPAVFRAPDGRSTVQRLPARDRARLVTHLVDQLRRRLRPPASPDR
jgi:nicotinamide-nucleotide amidase